MLTDSTSKPCLTRNAETKRRLKALRSWPVSDDQCGVPGCTGSALEGTDCCFRHSLHDAHNSSPGSLPNDGIIDWIAIDLAVQGARPVRLTRVERDIVIAKLLKAGMAPSAISDYMGINYASIFGGRRAEEIARIMAALPDA